MGRMGRNGLTEYLRLRFSTKREKREDQVCAHHNTILTSTTLESNMSLRKTDPPEWPRIDFSAPGRVTTSWEAQQAVIGRVARSLPVVAPHRGSLARRLFACSRTRVSGRRRGL